MKTRILFTFLAFVLAGSAFGQSKEDKAREKRNEASRLIDNGELDKAVDLLEECVKLQPGTCLYNYELGYAYSLQENYKKALSHLKKALNADDVTEDCYQLYGSVLEASGDTEGAMKAYDDGLTRFPNSGRLYITKGNAFAAKEEYGDAIVFYEKGIEMDPAYPANYVMATLLYCRLSEEEVWGMIYGEIYLNMPERNEEWAGPVSKILYDTYTSEITFPTDSTAGVSFSKNEITITDMSQLENLENLQLPFPLIAYETGLTVAAMFERSIDLASLDRIRSNFVNIYYDSGNDKTFPNVLFDYQKKVRDAGHMEAYNYWILQAGDTAAFTKWQENNRGKWDAFLAWRAENELVLDADNRFYRRQY